MPGGVPCHVREVQALHLNSTGWIALEVVGGIKKLVSLLEWNPEQFKNPVSKFFSFFGFNVFKRLLPGMDSAAQPSDTVFQVFNAA